MNGSDPSGLCVSLFNVVCVGGGSVSSTLSLRFDPGAAANASVNIGRGASFGLSDDVANWLSPGASCTVAQNGLDEDIGSAATIVASLGAGSAAEGAAAETTDALEPLYRVSMEGITGSIEGGLTISPETVEEVAAKYGIEFPEDAQVTIRGGAPSQYTGATYGATDIDIYEGAFTSEENLARTLYHESLHAAQYRGIRVWVRSDKCWLLRAVDLFGGAGLVGESGWRSIMSTEWDGWMRVVDSLLNSESAELLVCPNCQAVTVDRNFIAGPDRLGWGDVWCQTCNHGVHLSRVTFPPNVNTLSIDARSTAPTFTVAQARGNPISGSRLPALEGILVNQSDPGGCARNSQGNGNAWDLVNPWSSNNPIRCSAQKNPNSGGVHFVQEADPFYGAVAGYSGCRNSNYSVYTCANMNFNPAAVGLTAYSSCRNNMGASASSTALATPSIRSTGPSQGYSSEIQATESGCDFWTSLELRRRRCRGRGKH